MNKLIDQIMVRNGKTQYYVSITSEYIYRFKPKNNKKPRGGFCLLSWFKKKKEHVQKSIYFTVGLHIIWGSFKKLMDIVYFEKLMQRLKIFLHQSKLTF